MSEFLFTASQEQGEKQRNIVHVTGFPGSGKKRLAKHLQKKNILI